MKKGLSKEAIISASIGIIERNGYDVFSIRALAGELGVKAASLYNYVSGINEIKIAVLIKTAEDLGRALSEATEGKTPENAFIDGAAAYRSYAINNPELYKVIMRVPLSNNAEAARLGWLSLQPLLNVIHSFGLSDIELLNYFRSFRSFLHGYIELCNNGFMTLGPMSRDESFEFITQRYLEQLLRLKNTDKTQKGE